MNNSSIDNIILATAKVWVRDSSGNYKLGTALLDSCSQVNFITDEFSQKLRLSRSKQYIEIQGIVIGFELPLTFCITTHIAYQPDPEIDISSWNIPGNTTLADEEFHVPGKVDLLLGTETFSSLLSVVQIKLGTNLPILQKTLLGWVVSGRYQTTNNSIKPSCLLTANESLDARLE
ncbi:PREDICTED: uncharacterized protein LOC108358042 isoform X1 [Rhagoletis zephyria]|uniref:uncharacterized protein LOC108358042 isoform X1 n=1 Tax=Rhagoletis zephyria TaxID=28612 RepID=UPI000811A13B|nr:PREDICTED: uncharacterized protein LOC108358042 isoform X1 [Rhagoletis zephyria]